MALRHLTVLPFALVLLAPAAAGGDASSPVALGLGIHGALYRTDREADVGVGTQARLRLLEVLALRLDYDFGQRRAAVDPLEAQSLAQLVPFPDLRVAAGIYPLPNRYLSPHLFLGGGINTGAPDAPVLLAGAGLETTVRKHWSFGATVQLVYAMPGRYVTFLLAREGYGVRDCLVPRTYQVLFEASYYL